MRLSKMLLSFLHVIRRAFARQAVEALSATRRGMRYDPQMYDWNRELAEEAEPTMVSLVSQAAVLESRVWAPMPAPIRIPPPYVPDVATALMEPPRIVLGRTRMAPEIVEEARRLSFDFARSVNGQTAERLQAPYAEFREQLVQFAERGEAINELSKRVRSIVADPKRALTIARTEGRRATEAGRMIAAKRASITLGKRLIASPDACPICLSIAAERKPRPLDEPFYVWPKGGPYAVVQHAPIHPSCYCATGFVPM